MGFFDKILTGTIDCLDRTLRYANNKYQGSKAGSDDEVHYIDYAKMGGTGDDVKVPKRKVRSAVKKKYSTIAVNVKCLDGRELLKLFPAYKDEKTGKFDIDKFEYDLFFNKNARHVIAHTMMGGDNLIMDMFGLEDEEFDKFIMTLDFIADNPILKEDGWQYKLPVVQSESDSESKLQKCIAYNLCNDEVPQKDVEKFYDKIVAANLTS